ncbi:hypothetical protein BH11GEM2_BH11GEM2_16250 [soil metagenome]
MLRHASRVGSPRGRPCGENRARRLLGKRRTPVGHCFPASEVVAWSRTEALSRLAPARCECDRHHASQSPTAHHHVDGLRRLRRAIGACRRQRAGHAGTAGRVVHECLVFRHLRDLARQQNAPRANAIVWCESISIGSWQADARLQAPRLREAARRSYRRSPSLATRAPWCRARRSYSSQFVAILKLVIPAKAGIHLGPVNMDSRVRGNDERLSMHGFRMATD